jgi:YVTN family beta-propeller protein
MSFLRKIVLVSLVLCFTIVGFGNVVFLTQIEVGREAVSLAVNPETNRIYVKTKIEYGQKDGRVSVINGETNKVIANVQGFEQPTDVAVCPILNYFCVTTWEWDNNLFYIYNGSDNSLITTLDLQPYEGYWPWGIAVHNYLGTAFVACEGSNKIIQIFLPDKLISDVIDIGHESSTICANPLTDRIYVPNLDGDIVTVLGLDEGDFKVITTIAVGDEPMGICVNPQTNRIYVANYEDNTVSVIDGTNNSVIATIEVGDHPDCIDVNPQMNHIYVVNYWDQSLSVIDGSTNEVIQTVNDIGDHRIPCDVAVNPETNRIYISGYNYDYWEDKGLVYVFEDGVTGVEESPDNPTSPSFKVSPNPFSSITEFVLSLPAGTDNADFCIYDVGGTLVKSFSLGSGVSSSITLSWDGRDNEGNKCSSGVYFGVLKTGNNKPVMEKVIKLQ